MPTSCPALMPGLGGFRMPFAVHRGQRIHYTVEGEGPLVVLQHGLLMDGAAWKQAGFVAALSRAIPRRMPGFAGPRAERQAVRS